MRSKKAEVRGQRSEVREQGSGFRAGEARFRGSWAAALVLMLLAGCATPPAPSVTDEDWVSHVTTGRGLYARGDYRRGASAFERAQVRARALDDADALAVAAVNRAQCLLADDTPTRIIDRADAALYWAKRNGRNRVACYDTLAASGALVAHRQ